MSQQLLTLIDQLSQTHMLSEEALLLLLREHTPASDGYLFALAREACGSVYGNKVFVRGLIEITNHCKNDCLYCGIRRSASSTVRYRLSMEQILQCCENGYVMGIRTFVLQGGEDASFSREQLVEMIQTIKENYPDCAVTLSLGEWSADDYREFRMAGADRYLLRHETADEKLYASLHPAAQTFENRMQCLDDLKKEGYQVGCGFMVGSPGQKEEHLVRDLCFIKQFQPHMVGIGPFIPHHDTPFANERAGSIRQTLFLLGILRLLNPRLLLPATTALDTIDVHGWEKGIEAGANVVMVNLTPEDERSKYLLYDNKNRANDRVTAGKNKLSKRIASTGCEIAWVRGDYKYD